jgi:hypothetical protein
MEYDIDYLRSELRRLILSMRNKEQVAQDDVLKNIEFLDYIHVFSKDPEWPSQAREKTIKIVDTADGFEMSVDLKTYIAGPDPVPLTDDFIGYCADILDMGFQIYNMHTFVNVTTIVKPTVVAATADVVASVATANKADKTLTKSAKKTNRKKK